jgi:hypothetical protein
VNLLSARAGYLHASLQARCVASAAKVPAIELFSLGEVKTSRFCITGRKGAGKSTGLKIWKERKPDAILVGAGSKLLSEGILGQFASIGEHQACTIRYAIREKVPCLFLDGWDANLDHDVTKALD